MIRAEFSRSQGRFVQAKVSGHAGFAGYGEDIVCAAVTSAVQLTANGITEVLGVPATVEVSANQIAIALPQNSGQAASDFLAALHQHLEILADQYVNTISLTVMEV